MTPPQWPNGPLIQATGRFSGRGVYCIELGEIRYLWTRTISRRSGTPRGPIAAEREQRARCRQCRKGGRPKERATAFSSLSCIDVALPPKREVLAPGRWKNRWVGLFPCSRAIPMVNYSIGSSIKNFSRLWEIRLMGFIEGYMPKGGK